MNKNRPATFVAIPIVVFINVLISLSGLTTASIEYWGFDSLRFTQGMQTFDKLGGEIATLFTSQFLHAGLKHVLTNMIMLVLFGVLVERQLGALRFLGYYLASGAVGLLTLWAIGETGLFVGASASLSGITGAFLLLIAHRRARLNIGTALGGAYILLWWLPNQIVGSVLSVTGSMDSNIGYLGHLFGFIAGAILTWRNSSLPKTENQPLV